MKKLFLAELIFRLHDKTHPSTHHFDKYYFPINAASEKEAYLMTLIKASIELDNRKDYTKEYLQWEFIGLESLSQIEKLPCATAYHHKIQVPEDIPTYVYSLKKQSEVIQQRLTEQAS